MCRTCERHIKQAAILTAAIAEAFRELAVKVDPDAVMDIVEGFGSKATFDTSVELDETTTKFTRFLLDEAVPEEAT